ncbi:MAG TPA: PEP-CTERM sorting domain-containing protein [Gemmataceae bacterium]|jgi:hypothetical protein|nr:PEP-CTERM sorting domain-containing protein [Gemmataceae bacterium]
MKLLTRLGVQALLTLAAAGMTLGSARADLIQIDDLGEGFPTVTAGIPAAVNILAIGNDFVHFTYTSLPAGVTGPFYTDMLEADGTLSDRIIFTVQTGSPIIDVQFASDPNALPQPATGHIATFTENGHYQTVGVYRDTNTGQPIDTYQVRSDVDPVPEPATLALLGVGAASLAAGACWRKRRLLLKIA